MALLILPIGFVLGWFVRSPSRAATSTVVVGLAALATYLGVGLAGVVVSPLETLVLIVGTPIAAVVAYRVAQRRRQHRRARG